MKKFIVKANAKINLTLAVTGKREDGYHFIDTVMQSVTLADRITVCESEKTTVDCNIAELSCANNTAVVAARLFFEKTQISAGAEIYIEKNIPAAAGLGGGSADAAAVLTALNKIYNTNFSYDELCEIALKIGADVPFFISGGTKRVKGIGEKLTELPPIPNCWILLARRDKKLSTAEMYKQLDSKPYKVPNIEKQLSAVNKGDFSCLDNSFSVLWGNELKQRLLDTKADVVSLSGSGPFWFAVYKNYDVAVSAYEQLQKEQTECYLTKPSDSSLIFE